MADEYAGLAEKAELSYEEALALKDEIRRRGETREPAGDVIIPALRGWFITVVAGPSEATRLLRSAPAQGAGEASVTNRLDGRVDVYWFLHG